MPLVVGEPPVALLLEDDEPPTPPPASPMLTSSSTTRVHVYWSLSKSEAFEAFATRSYTGVTFRPSMVCTLCCELFDGPALCSKGCGFIACRACWMRTYAAGAAACPHCRAAQEAPAVANHVLRFV